MHAQACKCTHAKTYAHRHENGRGEMASCFQAQAASVGTSCAAREVHTSCGRGVLLLRSSWATECYLSPQPLLLGGDRTSGFPARPVPMCCRKSEVSVPGDCHLLHLYLILFLRSHQSHQRIRDCCRNRVPLLIELVLLKSWAKFPDVGS